MQTQLFWEFFRDTGAPEAYLLYKRSQREQNAPEGKKEGPECI